jgi:hypothetical protein
MDEISHKPPEFNRPDVHHEESDVSVSGIFRFAVVLVLLCVFSLALLVGLFQYFDSRDPLAPQLTRVPPAPRLEELPIRDLATFRQGEENLLNGYSWVDQSKGVVRIPIERAIDILAQRGLPSRAQQPQPLSKASIPTESSLTYKPGGESR